jgi:hypothetical protein
MAMRRGSLQCVAFTALLMVIGSTLSQCSSSPQVVENPADASVDSPVAPRQPAMDAAPSGLWDAALSGCVAPTQKDIPDRQLYPAQAMPSRVLVVGSGGIYARFADALAAAKDGDGIALHGDIAETLTINKRVVVSGEGATLTGAVIVTATATVQNLTIHAAGSDMGIDVQADDCWILNNTIDRFKKAGIRVHGVKGVVVGGNTVDGLNCALGSDCGDSGVWVANAQGITLSDNLVQHASYGMLVGPSGDGESGCSNCTVFRNKFDKNTEAEFAADSVDRLTFRANRIEDSVFDLAKPGLGVDAFHLHSGKDVQIDGNYIGSHYYGMKVHDSTRVLISNNVLDSSGVNLRLGQANGQPPEGAGPDILVRSNRITNAVDNIWVQISQGIWFECNEVYKSSDFNKSWVVSHGFNIQSGGPYMLLNNNLHDLVVAVLLATENGVAHDIDLVDNQFCHNGQDIKDEGCSSCGLGPGTRCP